MDPRGTASEKSRKNFMSDAATEKQWALQYPEHILQQSEQLFRVVWEFASDAMALSTADGIVFAANPA